jgi:putative transposase
MRKLSLKVTQCIAYKVATKKDLKDAVANNLLNQHFNRVRPDQVRAGNITYLKTGVGWIYLAIAMDLYSQRIVGWYISKGMTIVLISRATMMVYNLRQPP